MAAALPFGSAAAVDKEAPSSIQIAAGDGMLELVKQFVESGVSVNAADENGYTAMCVLECHKAAIPCTTCLNAQACCC